MALQCSHNVDLSLRLITTAPYALHGAKHTHTDTHTRKTDILLLLKRNLSKLTCS